jgi:hypothetical protein
MLSNSGKENLKPAASGRKLLKPGVDGKALVTDCPFCDKKYPLSEISGHIAACENVCCALDATFCAAYHHLYCIQCNCHIQPNTAASDGEAEQEEIAEDGSCLQGTHINSDGLSQECMN